MKSCRLRKSVLLFALMGVQAGHCYAVDIDWVTVSDAGNVADTAVMDRDGTTGYGAVDYVYNIGRVEVTIAQYVEFLNSVAADDPNGLYDVNMGGGFIIQRSGDPGSYSYSSEPGRERKPIAYVSAWDAFRFANWMHNGQPIGSQNPTTTEDGAYTMTPEAIANNSVTRNPGAMVFLPNEDEWYKAAYYKSGETDAGFWRYPTQSDTPPTAEAPPGGSNSSNYAGVIEDYSDVGAYTAALSPYGTLDQGGNVEEWNETLVDVTFRGSRGGDAGGSSFTQSSIARLWGPPELSSLLVGFRVASVPEPGSLTLGLLGVVLGVSRLRRRDRSPVRR